MSKPKSQPEDPGAEARRRFGERLRQLRKDRKLTGEELALKMGSSQATVSKVETGIQQATVEYLVALGTALSLSKGELTELVNELNRLPGIRQTEVLIPLALFDFAKTDDVERRQKEMEQLEARASAVRAYQPHLVPGLLQTGPYARSVIQLSGAVGEEQIKRGVAARLSRQRVLEKEKQFVFVITEGALRARVCPIPDMLEQLRHIRTVAQRRHVHICVFPWTAHIPVLALSSFFIFDTSRVYVELTHGEIGLTGGEEVTFYLERFECLLRHSLKSQDATAAIDRIAHDFQRLQEFEATFSPTLSDVPPPR